MITRQQFETKDEVINNLKTKTILILSSATCPPCIKLAEFLNKFKTEKNIPIFELKVPFFKDIEFFKDKFELSCFPTVIVVDENFNKIDKKVGYDGDDKFKEFINKHF
ncbi:hypothetical protein NAPIS_ORF02357 [Vairimorpha apis BRL 01]|uniref:Thioredoxin domain-containing protein n=1 Tax=Vairimorpha apis BRL 01 TaxID=1037528 RepID=T0L5W7_9MICR|nr:hypothetical protein NAPIS_ORF02357 [Vairimorpha apis BRL 01]